MKLRVLNATAIALVLVPGCFAQGRTSGPKNPGRVTEPQTRIGQPMPGITTPSLFLTGKVVTDDGSLLPDRATIQTICKGQIHTETYTDSHGGFSFEFRTQSTANNAGAVGLTDAESSMTNPTAMRGNQRDWHDCEMRAALPGFTSETIELAGKSLSFGNSDIGHIVVHRMGNVSGLTVSATTAAAPGNARKAFEKGLDKERKQKQADAQQALEKAVQIYPKYAVAWFELGRVQLQQNDATAARQSFLQALAADNKYVSPYQGLAEIAWKQQNWREVADFTNKLLALNPVNFPDAWFSNSVANFFLHDLVSAEKSARQELRVDAEHRIPKMEYVLGMVLMQKGNYPEATLHFQQYMTLVKNPADVEQAQKRIAEINQLTAQSSVAPAK
ncbi:MAG TPA: tetratricopeptide repeat protein [Terriglobales bacterium]|nr:tetratricopeptide repeat protein [Terriglobales bacterium]